MKLYFIQPGFLIIPKEPKESHVEMLRVCYRELDYEVSQIKPGINKFKLAGDRDLFELLIGKDLYHILDLGEDSTSIIPMLNTGRTLIISSQIVFVLESYTLQQVC